MHNALRPDICWCLACGDRRIRRNRRFKSLAEFAFGFICFAFGVGVMWLIQH